MKDAFFLPICETCSITSPDSRVGLFLPILSFVPLYAVMSGELFLQKFSLLFHDDFSKGNRLAGPYIRGLSYCSSRFRAARILDVRPSRGRQCVGRPQLARLVLRMVPLVCAVGTTNYAIQLLSFGILRSLSSVFTDLQKLHCAIQFLPTFFTRWACNVGEDLCVAVNCVLQPPPHPVKVYR